MQRKSSIPILIGVATLLATLIILPMLICSREGEVLFRMQEMSLWLPTRLFFEESNIYPGGTLTWASAWATQYFHSPALGMTLLALAWAVIVALAVATQRLRGWWILLATLLPITLATALTQTGYWIYYQKLQGHPWVPTMGVLWVLALQLPAMRLRGWARLAYVVFLSVVGYPLMGAWSFAAVFLAAVKRQEGETLKQRIYTVLTAVALTGLTPHVFYQWVYTQVMKSEIYVAAMPTLCVGPQDFAEFRLPYYALALVLALTAAAQWIGHRKHPVLLVALVALLATGVWGLNKRWYRDTNFHKEVAMTTAIENLDWEKVLRIMRDPNMGEKMPPTRLMVMQKNLALFRLGRAGDEMFHYPEGSEQYCLCGRHVAVTKASDGERDTTIHLPVGTAPSHNVNPIRITQVGGKLIYHNYGKQQFAYRWCMEDGVEFGWTVNALKYMAKTSLVSQDWEVARKYLELLRKTRYHRPWADHYSQFLQRPDLMEKDPEWVPILPMSQFTNRLDGDMTLVEMYLLKTFSNGMGADVYYQEMTLLCAMIMKDISLFWPRLHLYINMHKDLPNFRVPTHYQEAAYLYSVLEPERESLMWPGLTNAQAMERLPFDESVKKRYMDFMQFNQQCGSMSEEQKKVAFYPQFGDTFYYFYFLVRNQKTN